MRTGPLSPAGSRDAERALLQVDDGSGDPGSAAPRPAPLPAAEFRALCEEAPLQGAAGPWDFFSSFVPLTEAEEPRAGMLLGLDAEFVALSQPEAQLPGCAPQGLGLKFSNPKVAEPEGPRAAVPQLPRCAPLKAKCGTGVLRKLVEASTDLFRHSTTAQPRGCPVHGGPPLAARLLPLAAHSSFVACLPTIDDRNLGF